MFGSFHTTLFFLADLLNHPCKIFLDLHTHFGADLLFFLVDGVQIIIDVIEELYQFFCTEMRIGNAILFESELSHKIFGFLVICNRKQRCCSH